MCSESKRNAVNILSYSQRKSNLKKENSIFTEDLSKYGAFLHATNEGLEKAIIEMKQQIEARKKIIKIIEKYTETHTASTRDLNSLAKLSCPDFHSLDTLLDLIESFGIEPTSTYLKESSYKQSINCAGKSCAECWKNYINTTAHILNTAPVDIKNFTMDKDDD